MGVSQDHVTEKLLEYVPMLLDWIKQFMNDIPIPGKGEIEFRRYPVSCDLQHCNVVVQQDPKLPRR